MNFKTAIIIMLKEVMEWMQWMKIQEITVEKHQTKEQMKISKLKYNLYKRKVLDGLNKQEGKNREKN